MQTPAYTLQVQSFDIFRSLRQFFGLRTTPEYRKSRIRRKATQAFEEFVFAGYDRDQPDLFQPASFRALRPLCKN